MIMKKITAKQRGKIQQEIFTWYKTNQRSLPWRTTTDPYAILVSEIMLQQTQVDRVIPYYERFMRTFPNWEALANADKRTLLQHWSGLGYNQRALRLQETAKQIVVEGGRIPKTEEELCKLPGIGPYTACAVLAFAENQEVPGVDTNIRRVLIHKLKLSEAIGKKELATIAQSLIPRGKSRIWHNALMDYGALHATAQKTGIASLSKQSKFEGSERWVRGKMVKMLLNQESLSLRELKKTMKHARLKQIIQKMEKEQLIVKKEGWITLKEER